MKHPSVVCTHRALPERRRRRTAKDATRGNGKVYVKIQTMFVGGGKSRETRKQTKMKRSAAEDHRKRFLLARLLDCTATIRWFPSRLQQHSYKVSAAPTSVYSNALRSRPLRCLPPLCARTRRMCARARDHLGELGVCFAATAKRNDV